MVNVSTSSASQQQGQTSWSSRRTAQLNLDRRGQEVEEFVRAAVHVLAQCRAGVLFDRKRQFTALLTMAERSDVEDLAQHVERHSP
jgi:hypothetical protein